MSYIRASKVKQEDPVSAERGFHISEIDFEDRPDLDMNLDDEVLQFILALIAKVDELDDDEVLVVWKELF